MVIIHTVGEKALPNVATTFPLIVRLSATSKKGFERPRAEAWFITKVPVMVAVPRTVRSGSPSPGTGVSDKTVF